MSLSCAGNFKFAKLCMGWSRFESKKREGGATDGARLQEISASLSHGRVVASIFGCSM
jgi:hypothetical protein